MVNILMVCLGNICRSPMAEGVLREKIKQKGWESKVSVDSAGTGAYHIGQPVDYRTVETLAKHGISYQGVSRRIGKEDFFKHDLILVMDKDNLEKVSVMKPVNSKAQIKLLMEFAPVLDQNEVPDPWYDGNFEKVYEMIEAGCEGLVAELEEKIKENVM